MGVVQKYRYKAMTTTGELIGGVAEAASSTVLLDQLRAQGHYPISATDVAAMDWRQRLRGLFPHSKHISTKVLATSAKELASLLKAGLPLDRALEILSGLKLMSRLRAPLEEALATLRDGSNLADALSQTGAFPRFYLSMLKAGELTGSWDETLLRLADYLERRQALQDKIVSALIYPAMLLTTAGLSVAVILVYVLPEFQPFFESAGREPPLSARIMLAAGALLSGYGWLLAILGLASVAAVRHWLSRPSNRIRFDRRILRLPLLGRLLMAAETERFARTLGTLIQHGVPLFTALSITAETVSNQVVSKTLSEIARALREGASLTGLLTRSNLFPPLLIDLAHVGEETGKLDEMLVRVADMTERGLRQDIDRLLAILVPSLTIVLGIVVAGLIITLMTAILSVNDLAFQ